MKWLFASVLIVLSLIAVYAHAQSIPSGCTTTTCAGLALPSGYLSVSGNQFKDGQGNNVRISCTTFTGSNQGQAGVFTAIRNAGFNCVRIPWRDVGLTAGGGNTGCDTFAHWDTCVANAQAAGLGVIAVHYGNEVVASSSSCFHVQQNGLWFDSGGSSGDNDGCGNTGAVTYATFKSNTIALMQRYSGNTTVIGYELHHEPKVIGSNSGVCTVQCSTGNADVTWGGGGDTDLRSACVDVGTSVIAVNFGVILFCPGAVNTSTTMLNGVAMTAGNSGIMDLSGASTNPVTLSNGRVAYSVDLYPTNVNGATPDSGTNLVTAYNTFFGNLEKNGLAPVMIMELGCSCDGTNGNLTDDTAWATAAMPYLQGTASSGPSFTGTQQPFSNAWWAWGTGLGNPDGILNADGITLKVGQQQYWYQLTYTLKVTPPPQATSWNPGDKSPGITLSNANLTATSGAGASNTVRSTASKSSGKICFEVVANTITPDWDVGLANSSYDLANPAGLGVDNNGIGFDPNYNVSTSATLGIFLSVLITHATDSVGDANGAAATMCEDFGAQLFWASTPRMRALGNNWNNSASANPATGTGGISTSALICPCFVTFNNLASEVGVATLNTIGPFAVATPAGFTAWDVLTRTAFPVTIMLGQ